MHEFGGADNGIYGAGGDAFGAADALVFADYGDFERGVLAHGGVQLGDRMAGDNGQADNGLGAAWWAAVDGLAGSNGFRIGATTLVSAFGALRLGQGCIDLFG